MWRRLPTHGIHPAEPLAELRAVLNPASIWSAEALGRHRAAASVRGLRVCLDKSSPTCSFAPVWFFRQDGVLPNPTTLTKSLPTLLCTAGAGANLFFPYKCVHRYTGSTGRVGRLKPRVPVMQDACVRSAGAAAACLEKKRCRNEMWNAAPVKVSSGVWFPSDFLSFSVSRNYLDLLQMCPLFTSPPQFGHSASFHAHN